MEIVFTETNGGAFPLSSPSGPGGERLCSAPLDFLLLFFFLFFFFFGERREEDESTGDDGDDKLAERSSSESPETVVLSSTKSGTEHTSSGREGEFP